MDFKVIISKNNERLLIAEPNVTVGAEYDDAIVEGTMTTIIHRPCTGYNYSVNEEYVTIGINHFDLDILGGILRVLGKKDIRHELFWKLVSEITIRGVYQIESISNVFNISYRINDIVDFLEKVYAFLAWNQKNELCILSKHDVIDCTDYINMAIEALDKIFDGDEDLLKAGDVYIKHCHHRNQASYVENYGNVLLRCSDEYVNDMFDYDGSVYDAIVAFYPKVGYIAISLECRSDGFSCSEFMKEWSEYEIIGSDTEATSYEKFDIGDARIIARNLSRRL